MCSQGNPGGVNHKLVLQFHKEILGLKNLFQWQMHMYIIYVVQHEIYMNRCRMARSR